MVLNPDESEATKLPSPLGVVPLDFAPLHEDVPLRVVDYKRYLRVMLPSDIGIGATLPTFAGQDVGCVKCCCSPLWQFGHLFLCV